MADLPTTLHGWPVRWESRGRADDGDITRSGLTAVVDGSRIPDGFSFQVRIGGFPQHVDWPGSDLDGQPLDALDDLARALAVGLLRVKVEAPNG